MRYVEVTCALIVPNRINKYGAFANERCFSSKELYAHLRVLSTDSNARYFLHPVIDFQNESLTVFLVDELGVTRVKTFNSVKMDSFILRSTVIGWSSFSQTMKHVLSNSIYDFVDKRFSVDNFKTNGLSNLAHLSSRVIENGTVVLFTHKKSNTNIRLRIPIEFTASLNERDSVIDLARITPCANSHDGEAVVTYGDYLKIYRRSRTINDNVSSDLKLHGLKWYCENQRDSNPRLYTASDRNINRYKRSYHRNSVELSPMYT